MHIMSGLGSFTRLEGLVRGLAGFRGWKVADGVGGMGGLSDMH